MNEYRKNLINELGNYLPPDISKYEISPCLDDCDVVTQNGNKCFSNDLFFYFEENNNTYSNCERYCLKHINEWIEKRVKTPPTRFTITNEYGERREYNIEKVKEFTIIYKKSHNIILLNMLDGVFYKNSHHKSIEDNGSKIDDFRQNYDELTFRLNFESKEPIEYSNKMKMKINKYFKTLNNSQINIIENDVWIGINVEKNNWRSIIQNKKLNKSFLRQFKTTIDWNLVSIYQTLDSEIIDEFSELLNWESVIKYQRLNKDLIKKYNERIDWELLSRYQKLESEIIDEFSELLDWESLIKYQRLNTYLIKKYNERIDWELLSRYQKLSEDNIREFGDRVDWRLISQYQTLSEDFIREFRDKIDWNQLSKRQLSEDFIREFGDQLDWDQLAIYGNLNKEFLTEFKDKINWKYVRRIRKTRWD